MSHFQLQKKCKCNARTLLQNLHDFEISKNKQNAVIETIDLISNHFVGLDNTRYQIAS